MKILLLISVILIVGCYMPVTNYKGEKSDIHKRPFTIVSYERSAMNNDIFYLTCIVSYPNSTRTSHGKAMAMEKEFANIMKDYDYTYYQVVSINRAGFWVTYMIYKVHFHKTEEDFDKWNVRYKN